MKIESKLRQLGFKPNQVKRITSACSISSGTVYVVESDGLTLQGPDGHTQTLVDFVNKMPGWLRKGVSVKVDGQEVDSISGEYPEGTRIEIGSRQAEPGSLQDICKIRPSGSCVNSRYHGDTATEPVSMKKALNQFISIFGRAPTEVTVSADAFSGQFYSTDNPITEADFDDIISWLDDLGEDVGDPKFTFADYEDYPEWYRKGKDSQEYSWEPMYDPVGWFAGSSPLESDHEANLALIKEQMKSVPKKEGISSKASGSKTDIWNIPVGVKRTYSFNDLNGNPYSLWVEHLSEPIDYNDDKVSFTSCTEMGESEAVGFSAKDAAKNAIRWNEDPSYVDESCIEDITEVSDNQIDSKCK